jgi:hypothetical protein
MKIRPVGAEFFPADVRVDTTKLIVDFRNFANAPKNLGNTCVCQAITRHPVRTHDIVSKQHNTHFSYIIQSIIRARGRIFSFAHP